MDIGTCARPFYGKVIERKRSMSVVRGLEEDTEL
jgi:hypothetical protein